MTKKIANNILIIGVGLIGGSLGKAIKKNHLADHVWGVSRKQAHLTLAKKSGVIDAGSTRLEEWVSKADLIVLAAPVSQILPLAKKVARLKSPHAVVTDVSSVKGALVATCDDLFHGMFVGGHPMAGSDQSGVAFANPALFKGAVCILTPTKKTDKKAEQKVAALWRAVGARVALMSPEQHDTVTAHISHLPHLLSAALVQSLNCGKNKPEEFLAFAGGGFRDMSRIAGSDPELWAEILLANRTEIKKALGQTLTLLQQWKNFLETKNEKKILKALSQAQSIRRKL
jgi:prephenate dehydrogenase